MEEASVTSEEFWRSNNNALLIEDEEGYEEDLRLMESLFERPEKRYQRLLASLDNHSSPVNCVRWNSVGTLFASAADNGEIFLWEYVGEMAFASGGLNQVPKSNLLPTAEDSKQKEEP